MNVTEIVLNVLIIAANSWVFYHYGKTDERTRWTKSAARIGILNGPAGPVAEGEMPPVGFFGMYYLSPVGFTRTKATALHVIKVEEGET